MKRDWIPHGVTGEEQTHLSSRWCQWKGKHVDWFTRAEGKERGTVVIGSWPEGTLGKHCRNLWCHLLTVLLESSPTPHCLRRDVCLRPQEHSQQTGGGGIPSSLLLGRWWNRHPWVSCSAWNVGIYILGFWIYSWIHFSEFHHQEYRYSWWWNSVRLLKGVDIGVMYVRYIRLRQQSRAAESCHFYPQNICPPISIST